MNGNVKTTFADISWNTDDIFYKNSDEITQTENRVLLSKRDLDRFQNSIKENGFLDPIVLKADGSLADGRKRLCAAFCLDIPIVPCVLDTSSYVSTDKQMLSHILSRRDDFFTDAMSISTLIEKNLLTQDSVAEALGVSQSYVANKLRLLQLSPEDRRTVLKNRLTERHARTVLRIKDRDIRSQALKAIAENGMTVSAAESYVDSLIAETSTPVQSSGGAIRHACRAIDKAVNTAENLGIPVTLRRFDDRDYVSYSIRLKR